MTEYVKTELAIMVDSKESPVIRIRAIRRILLASGDTNSKLYWALTSLQNSVESDQLTISLEQKIHELNKEARSVRP